MAGFPTFDAIINALTVNQLGQSLHFNKLVAGTPIAGTPHTLWSATGQPVAGGNTTQGKANGAVCTSATAGAIVYANPTPPATMHLLGLGGCVLGAFNPATFVLVDRIAHVNLNQAEATGAITGLTATSRLGATSGAGDGCQIWCEVTGTLSAPGNVITYSYTNQNGTGSRVTQSITQTGNNTPGCSMTPSLWQPLQSGDRSVRSIESVTLVSGTSAGAYNLCLVRPLARFTLMGGCLVTERDCVMEMPKLPRLYDNSCLQLIMVPYVTGNPLIIGSVMTAEN